MLEMDHLTEIQHPDLAIDTARLHLDCVRDAALDVYRLLDAAHNKTAYIAVADTLATDTEANMQIITSIVSRRDNRQPPPLRGGDPARALSR